MKLSRPLAAILAGAAVSAASATSIDTCLRTAVDTFRDSFNKSAVYLGYKRSEVGNSASVAVAISNFSLPSPSSSLTPTPVLKNDNGIMVINTKMSFVLFYEERLSDVIKPGQAFSQANFDPIGTLVSLRKGREVLKPESARNVVGEPPVRILQIASDICFD